MLLPTGAMMKSEEEDEDRDLIHKFMKDSLCWGGRTDNDRTRVMIRGS